MPTNLYRYRKQQVRARSHDMRCGLGYQCYNALWRSSVGFPRKRTTRALLLLSRNKTLTQTDPGAYFQSPAGRRYEMDEDKLETEQTSTI